MSPTGLKETIEVATRVEKKNVMVKPILSSSAKSPAISTGRGDFKTISWTLLKSRKAYTSFGLSNSLNQSTSSINNKSAAASSNPQTSNATSNTATSKFKRLTGAEAQLKCDKGLCYRCDER